MTLAEPVKQAMSAGVLMSSKPCVCSVERRGVIVRLPCALPPGCRIECRARGVVVPTESTQLLDSNGENLIHVLMPRTDLDGPALLEVVRSDATPLGMPPAVLLLTTDSSVAAAVNAALDPLRLPTPPTRSTMYALGNALIGRASSPERIIALLRWACSLRVKSGEDEEDEEGDVINPLVNLLLHLYPLTKRRDAADVLFHAVTSESLDRVMLVLEHICPSDLSSFDDDVDDEDGVDGVAAGGDCECDGLALVPLRVGEGRHASAGIFTAMHAAAMLPDGAIACALLATPGITAPSNWFEFYLRRADGVMVTLTPGALAEAAAAAAARRLHSSVMHLRSRRLPGVMVPRILTDAAAITLDVMRRATATLSAQASDPATTTTTTGYNPDNVVQLAFSMMISEEDDSFDEENTTIDTRDMVKSMLLDPDFSYHLADVLAAVDDASAESTSWANDFISALELKLSHVYAEDQSPAYESFKDTDYDSSNDTVTTSSEGFGIGFPGAVYSNCRSLLGALARSVSCFIPDANRSLFNHREHGGFRGGERGLEEAFIRNWFSTCRSTPAIDVEVMLVGFIVVCFGVLKYRDGYDVSLSTRRYIDLLTPTGFLDGSLLTRTVAGLGAPACIVISAALVRLDLNSWLRWRETLIIIFRLLLVALMFHFQQGMAVESCVAKFQCLRILCMAAVTVVSPLRFERHVALEAIRSTLTSSFVVNRCGWGIVPSLIFANLVSNGAAAAFLWHSERQNRRRLKFDAKPFSRLSNSKPTPGDFSSKRRPKLE